MYSLIYDILIDTNNVVLLHQKFWSLGSVCVDIITPGVERHFPHFDSAGWLGYDEEPEVVWVFTEFVNAEKTSS